MLVSKEHRILVRIPIEMVRVGILIDFVQNVTHNNVIEDITHQIKI